MNRKKVKLISVSFFFQIMQNFTGAEFVWLSNGDNLAINHQCGQGAQRQRLDQLPSFLGIRVGNLQ